MDWRSSPRTRVGSIVGKRVGIFGFGVGKGIFVPSGIEIVGNGTDKGSNCVGVDSMGIVAV